MEFVRRMRKSLDIGRTEHSGYLSTSVNPHCGYKAYLATLTNSCCCRILRSN
jgi:hypothetical protein